MRRLVFAILLLAAAAPAAPASARTAAAREPVRLDVLFTSDIHGHIDRGAATFLSPEFPPTLGGGAVIAAYVQRVRAEARARDGRVLLFDSGDLFQGTPLAAATKGAAVIEWMNRVRYDAIALGNHDFDLGRDNTERLARLAQFPVLAANLVDSTTGRRPEWVGDRKWFEASGIRIAVLGYITESTVHMAFARNLAGLGFRRVIDMLPGDVRRARDDGADLVFVLLHHGLPYTGEIADAWRTLQARVARGEAAHEGMDALELAHVVPGIDAIFAGHTHQGYALPWQDPVTHTLVFEPYGNGSSLGHVTFAIDPGTQQIVGWDTHFDRGALLTLLEDEVWPDSTEAAILGAQVKEAEKGLEVTVGRTEVPLAGGAAGSGLLGFVMADAFREESGADFAIQNTGGVRGAIPAGPVTERQLLTATPFGNQIVLVRMTGALLSAVIEDRLRGRGGGLFVSGGAVRWSPARPDGERLISFTIGGAPVDSNRVYRVAMTDYLAEGNSGLDRLRELPAENILPTGFTDREVLARWFRRHGSVAPRNDGRWVQAGTP